MIKAVDLVKYFDRRPAVRGVSFEARRGEVLGVLGPNGAGKTTTMRMLTGFLPPDSGAASVGDFDVVRQPVEARRLLGYLPENAPAYGDMTVEAFLRFAAEMRGFAGRERDGRVDAALERCLLGPVRRQPIETLSKGYRQRTCFAQAILHDPPVLIMDEPTEGLDPNQKQVVRDMIRQMGREKAILLSTHILEEVEAICTRAVIISAGRIVADGAPAELKRRSGDYHAVTLTIEGAAAAAARALHELAAVRRVETLAEADGRATLRVVPHDGKLILGEAMELARAKGWKVSDVQSSGGRLEDVFRALTTTADAGGAPGKEAA